MKIFFLISIFIFCVVASTEITLDARIPKDCPMHVKEIGSQSHSVFENDGFGILTNTGIFSVVGTVNIQIMRCENCTVEVTIYMNNVGFCSTSIILMSDVVYVPRDHVTIWFTFTTHNDEFERCQLMTTTWPHMKIQHHLIHDPPLQVKISDTPKWDVHLKYSNVSTENSFIVTDYTFNIKSDQ